MTPGYEPKNLVQALGLLVEECGEVQQAVGKIIRFGEDGSYDNGETNIQALVRELKDLELAIGQARLQILIWQSGARGDRTRV